MRLRVYGYATNKSLRVVAAPSKKAAAEALLSIDKVNVSPTGANLTAIQEEAAIAAATAEPGVVFYRPTSAIVGMAFARHGEEWTARVAWIRRRYGIDHAEVAGVELRVEPIMRDRAPTVFRPSVSLDGFHRKTAMASELTREGARREAESMARKLIVEERRRLYGALIALGSELVTEGVEVLSPLGDGRDDAPQIQAALARAAERSETR